MVRISGRRWHVELSMCSAVRPGITRKMLGASAPVWHCFRDADIGAPYRHHYRRAFDDTA